MPTKPEKRETELDHVEQERRATLQVIVVPVLRCLVKLLLALAAN